MSINIKNLEMIFKNEDDKKFFEEHRSGIYKLREYRNTCFHKDKAYLYLQVYNSLSLFPDDVIEKLISILDIMQNYNYKDYEGEYNNFNIDCADIAFGLIDISEELNDNINENENNVDIDENISDDSIDIKNNFSRLKGFLLVNKILRSIVNNYYA